jgi:hypothetical protein
MDLNDDDLHIRRNLVFVSSSIIFAAWLELPAASLLAAVSPDASTIPQHKFWVIGLVILSYLLWRFSDTVDGKNLWKKTSGAAMQYILARMTADIQRAGALFLGSGTVSKPFSTPPGQILQAIAAPGQQRPPVVQSNEFYFRGELSEVSYSLRTMTAKAHYEKDTPSLNRHQHVEDLKWDRTLVVGIAWTRALLTSDTAIKCLFPVAWCATAMGILLWRIFGLLIT